MMRGEECWVGHEMEMRTWMEVWLTCQMDHFQLPGGYGLAAAMFEGEKIDPIWTLHLGRNIFMH
jgi:hypothetical protein